MGWPFAEEPEVGLLALPGWPIGEEPEVGLLALPGWPFEAAVVMERSLVPWAVGKSMRTCQEAQRAVGAAAVAWRLPAEEANSHP